MAVNECRYKEPPTATQNRRGLGSYTVKWQVITDSHMEPGAVIVACESVGGSNDPVPSLYDVYSYKGTTDNYAYCQGRRARPMYPAEGRYVWEVECTYEPLPDGKDPTDLDEDPTAREVEFSTDWEVYTEVAERDVNDKAILNPCRRPFDVQIELEKSRSVLVASFNVSTFAIAVSKMLKYQGAVNKTTWSFGGSSISPRVALCRNIQTSGLLTEGANSYYRVTARVSFREAGLTWDEQLEARGFGYYEEPNDPDTYTNKDVFTGGEITEPLLLKQDGTIIDTQTDEPYTMSFRVRKEEDFANLFSSTVV